MKFLMMFGLLMLSLNSYACTDDEVFDGKRIPGCKGGDCSDTTKDIPKKPTSKDV